LRGVALQRLSSNDGKLVIALTTSGLAGTAVQPAEWGYPRTAAEAVRYRVFADLHARGYTMTSGAKFGGDYLAYPGDPLLYHAQYTVRCLHGSTPLHPLALAAAARMAHAARCVPRLCRAVGAQAEPRRTAGSTWCSHQCFRQSRARRRASSTSRCRRTSSRARTASAQCATLHAELPPWKRRLRRCARCRLPDSLMCATRVTVALGVSNTPRVAQSSYARSPQAQRLFMASQSGQQREEAAACGASFWAM